VISVVRDPGCVSTGPAGLAVWVGAFLVFGAAFFRASRTDAPDGKDAWRSLLVQTCAALTMNVVLCTGFEAGLLVVVAVQLGLVLALRTALPWLALQTALIVLLATHHMGWFRGAIWSVAVVGAETFAFTVAAIAGREADARRALEKTNAELEATRESLARTSRDAERLRIARELHDLLGHDLIALHLEIETARHLADPKAKEPVERAHLVAKRLLADLRSAVSTLREDEGPVDVVARVRGVVGAATAPRVHLDAPATLDVPDLERANAIVRCAQEIVTNARKHAEAQNLWISLASGEGRIQLTAKDDGRGSTALVPGNGLVGMRERIEKLGGALTLETGKGDGFRVEATLPLSGEERS
jgi:signal transduction histidine kinase